MVKKTTLQQRNLHGAPERLRDIRLGNFSLPNSRRVHMTSFRPRGNGTENSMVLYNQSNFLRVMRNIVSIRKMLKMDHSSSSSCTWMICCSLDEMSKSLLNLFCNCGWSSQWRSCATYCWMKSRRHHEEDYFCLRPITSKESSSASTCSRSIYFDPTPSQPLVVSERLPNIWFGAGLYEVSTICTNIWLHNNVCYGRNMTRYNTCHRNHKQIHAQPWRIALEHNQAYI